MVAEANYGGRVTDTWDRRLINTILNDFYTPKALGAKYSLTRGGEYVIPLETYIEDYINYIKEKLSAEDLTEVFGLHPNANMTSAINEANVLLSTSLSLLPRTVASTGKSQGEILTEMCDDILGKIPEVFDIEFARKKYPSLPEQCLNTVLIQELIRFNGLIKAVKDTTLDLKRAIAGL
jgi:dynein heavy chain